MVKIKALLNNLSVKDMFLGGMLVLGLIWLNTFIHQNSFSDGYGDFFFLKRFAIVAFYTGLYFWLLRNLYDGDLFYGNTKECVTGTAVSGILMLAFVLLELGTVWFSIYGEKEVVIGWLRISKKYFYDVWAIVWFPFNVDAVFKGMKREHFEFRSILNGCIVILGLTIEGILLFRPMSNIWLVDLIVLNVATLVFAVWKYALSDINVHKGNALAGIISYAIIRICLLPFQCDNWGSNLTLFMYGEEWEEVKSVINEVVDNASLWGTAEYLRSSPALHNWLSDRNKPILQLLYYGGWISVIVLLLALTYLIWLLVKMLGIQNAREHKRWLIYATAVVMLSVRAVFGVLYGFGIPYPIALPFMGNDGIMDAMAFALILFCAWENIQIQKSKQLNGAFVLAETLLGEQDSYQVKYENNEPYKEELLFDDVTVIGKDGEIPCVADWYSLMERKFCVFATKDVHLQGIRFILEFADNRWILPNDPENEIKKQVSKLYVTYNATYCMEEELEFIDEEFKEENYEDT